VFLHILGKTLIVPYFDIVMYFHPEVRREFITFLYKKRMGTCVHYLMLSCLFVVKDLKA